MDKGAQAVVKRSREITESYLQFLDRHIADLVSGQVDDFMEINEIAKALFVSHQHLTDTVQKETGQHPCHFYDLKIIEKAQQMLMETPESVSAIARILTYDPSNFSKFFKKITGETPGQYRETHKK
ncbi:MAG: AraC family transcriptional regulator [Taibaiella sp.]|nr:AraC family transcriptional regulator [Taibaiella sp.]